MGLGADSPGGAESDIGGSESNAGNSSSSGGSGNETTTGLGGYFSTDPTSGEFGYSATDPNSSLDNDTVESLAVQAIVSDPTRTLGPANPTGYGIGTDEQARDNSIENSLMNNEEDSIDSVMEKMGRWTGGLVDKDEVEKAVNYWDRRDIVAGMTQEEIAKKREDAVKVGLDTNFIDDKIGDQNGIWGSAAEVATNVVGSGLLGLLDSMAFGLPSLALGALGIDTTDLGRRSAQAVEDSNRAGAWGSTAGTAGTATSSGTSGSSAGPTGSSPGGFSTGGFSTTERDNQDASLAAALSTRPSDILLDSYKDSLAGKVT